MHGHRDTTTGLWLLPSANSNSTRTVPPTPTGHQINSVYELTIKQDVVQYLHKCCFSPATTTWLKAIQKGFFTTWPGLTTELVTKHLPKSDATIKGHMRQAYKNTRSTQPTDNNQQLDQATTESTQATARTNDIFVATFEPTGQIYTDQTGRFPVPSSRGNKYIMVLYDYDSNAILAEPMKSRNDKEMVRAYSSMLKHLELRGLKPQLQKLDNEAPPGLKEYMFQHHVNYQLVPPHVHRRNAAERAISTFKDHFIAVLASTDKLFPMHLWDRLIPQSILTLNLMRQSRLNPRLSAEAQLNGAFDFNKTPLAPPGTRVIVHEKPSVRQ